jgi:hypothetical protein
VGGVDSHHNTGGGNQEHHREGPAWVTTIGVQFLTFNLKEKQNDNLSEENRGVYQ